jgi:hypothetical protein
MKKLSLAMRIATLAWETVEFWIKFTNEKTAKI